MKRECTEATILDRMTEMRGHRYQASTLASYFGVGSPSIRVTLEAMAAKNRIRRVSGYGSATVFFVPSDEDLRLEARETHARMFRPLVPDPVLIERVKASQAHREAFPSRFDLEAV